MNVYQDKVSQLKKTTGWKIKDCEQFVSYVIEYLDACGYFIGDYNIHNLPYPDNWVKYSDKDFGQWLLDMALQYNMENGKEYKYVLINSNAQTMNNNEIKIGNYEK